MDFIPGYLLPLTQHPIIHNLTTTSPAAHLASLRLNYLDPYCIQPLSTLLASSTPDLVSVLLLAVILLLSLKILDYARRIVLFWVTLAIRVAFWGTLAAVAWYVYYAGLERAGRDVGWVWGVVMGFVEDFQRGIEGGKKGSV